MDSEASGTRRNGAGGNGEPRLVGISVRSPLRPGHPQSKPGWRKELSSYSMSHQHKGDTRKATMGSGGHEWGSSGRTGEGTATSLEILLVGMASAEEDEQGIHDTP